MVGRYCTESRRATHLGGLGDSHAHRWCLPPLKDGTQVRVVPRHWTVAGRVKIAVAKTASQTTCALAFATCASIHSSWLVEHLAAALQYNVHRIRVRNWHQHPHKRHHAAHVGVACASPPSAATHPALADRRECRMGGVLQGRWSKARARALCSRRTWW